MPVELSTWIRGGNEPPPPTKYQPNVQWSSHPEESTSRSNMPFPLLVLRPSLGSRTTKVFWVGVERVRLGRTWLRLGSKGSVRRETGS